MKWNNILSPCISALLLFTAISLTSCTEEEDPPQEVVLNVNPEILEFDAEGGVESLQITSNTTWSASIGEDWIALSENSSDGNATISVTVQPNPNSENRQVTLTITAGDHLQEVQVVQLALDGIAYDIPPDNTGMRDLSSVDMARDIRVGWNLGNSLEAIGGETAWGNPRVTKQLIDSVKAAGFNSVRIPVAWSRFSNASNFTIDPGWMNRVEEVVNYVLDNDMYAIINIHWDNGWIIPTYEEQEYVTSRLDVMWRQIATNFRDYDDKLLFAGTNEVMVEGDYGTPTEEYYTVQNGYNQTFVNTVRATGGRNAFRHLVVQGFNTNIDHTVNFAIMPEDVLEERLMMEVHYYDPYNFTLNENSNITQWGNIATNPSATETWANESYVDRQFAKMKSNFIDKGVGVILGEYGAISRNQVEGHEKFRTYYNEYITQSAAVHGLVPFYWDNGYAGNYGFAIFNRSNGSPLYPDMISIIMEGVK